MEEFQALMETLHWCNSVSAVSVMPSGVAQWCSGVYETVLQQYFAGDYDRFFRFYTEWQKIQP